MANITRDILQKAKEYGFSDKQLSVLLKTDENSVRKLRFEHGVIPGFKSVDTCAAEFEAYTPYFYSTYDGNNEPKPSDRKKVIILGGGPNRIGQGIEFDYCCVHAVFALKAKGFETIMVNCNPETVSTDYDTTDRLYFEPLTFEDVMNIIDFEKPDGVIVTFGGQTPLKLAQRLADAGVNILGTSPEGIALAEDRKLFGNLIDSIGIPVPEWGTAFSFTEAKVIAEKIGYPVLVRPSFVLGGRAMQIVNSTSELETYMKFAVEVSDEHPILIDKFLENAIEFDVDAVCDGDDVYIGGILEHIEEAGIHSGDSTSVLPPQFATQKLDVIREYTVRIAKALKVLGPLNIQFAQQGSQVYILEVNPRASRTVPFVSKSTGVPLAKIAARIMTGEKLKDLNLPEFTYRGYITVKSSVFPFSKFPNAGVFLGPEMRSTGEVMGISPNFGGAFAKSQLSAGNRLPKKGSIFISVNDRDKGDRLLQAVDGLARFGFKLLATQGTATYLREKGYEVETVFKVNEGRPDIVDMIKNGEIAMVFNTPLGAASRFDENAIGSAAILHRVPVITTVSGAQAAVKGIYRTLEENWVVRSIQEYYQYELV
ncbi:MAG: carbamoyl-phosphate synthase large subunit [Bacteroidetes bacterium]|nr:carbamoyl-phosphate synthase large subunit [Bacteroidota bacterium]